MGSGLMPDLVRAFDWSRTPLGPIHLWSDTLISNVNQVLFSPIPAILSWGDDFAFFYNEAAIPALQGKHPHALGDSYRNVYKEVWHLVGQDLEDCYYRGRTVIRENMLIPLLHDGVLRDGYFTYYLIPIFENGRIAGIYDPYMNTTDAVQTKRELAQVAAQFGQVLSATRDAIVALDRNWCFSYLNDAALKTYSNGRELVGRNIWDEFPHAGEPGSPYREHYTRAMDDNLPGSFEALYPDPLNIWIQLEVYPTTDGIVTFSRDITSRKKAEAALLVSEKLAAVGRLASSISHEINNPLEAVTNLLYLARHTADHADIQLYLNQAEQELRRIAILANQTLRFRKQSSIPQPILCADLFAGVLSLLEGKVKNSGIHVARRDRNPTPIHVFEGDIRQVLSNIIGNAIDATPRNGRLVLRSRPATHWPTSRPGTLLTIADTGRGMPPEVLARVFEPFYTTKGIVGTGLGLWISKDIFDRHHGQLKIRSSQHPTHTGTVVQLFLPLQPSPAQAPSL
jgi:signal transduction histidine kinase